MCVCLLRHAGQVQSVRLRSVWFQRVPAPDASDGGRRRGRTRRRTAGGVCPRMDQPDQREGKPPPHVH